MSNKGKFIDNTPFLRTSGITTALEGVTADQSIRQDIHWKPRTSTPEHIKKYRKSVREVPGVKQLHPGIFNDPKEYEKLIHGIKTQDSEHVDQCIKGRNLSGIKFFENEIQESKYARNNREPLGKSIIRNYEFPEKVKEDNFKFGIQTTGFYNAKDVIYSTSNMKEPEDVKRMYNKTHGLTDPGEQKNRNYNWSFNKESHVFGKMLPFEHDGARKSLMSDMSEAPYPKTRIVDKRLEDFRQATSDVVGRSKFRGTLHPSIDENHVFGKKSVVGGNWNVGKCLSGDPEEKKNFEYSPDVDLGKSLTHRTKKDQLKPAEVDPNKTFGVPSIRRDLLRNRTSICDTINYGNEKDAYDLLYPNPNAFRGLEDPDFEALLEKDNLREMLKNNNYEFSDEEFNLIILLTLRNFPNAENKISYKSFIEVMRNLKREYMKYRTLMS